MAKPTHIIEAAPPLSAVEVNESGVCGLRRMS